MYADQQVRIGALSVVQTGNQLHSAVGRVVHVYVGAHGFQLCFQIFGNCQVHLVLVVILTEAQGAQIDAAVSGIDHNSGAAHRGGRIVALEHQIAGIRFVVCLIAQKAVFKLQLQRAAAPGSGTEQRILRKSQIIRHTVGIMEFYTDGAGGIAECVRRLLRHFQLHIGMSAVADDLQAGNDILLHRSSDSGNVFGIDPAAGSQIVVRIGGAALFVDQLIAHHKVQAAFAQGEIIRLRQIIQRIVREGLRLGGCHLHQHAIADLHFFIDRYISALQRVGHTAPAGGNRYIPQFLHRRSRRGNGKLAAEFYKVGVLIRRVVVRRIAGQLNRLPPQRGGDLGVLIRHRGYRDLCPSVYRQIALGRNAFQHFHHTGDVIGHILIFVFKGESVQTRLQFQFHAEVAVFIPIQLFAVEQRVKMRIGRTAEHNRRLIGGKRCLFGFSNLQLGGKILHVQFLVKELFQRGRTALRICFQPA